ncbi:MAG: class I SAM-dependent methyltransferase [Chloroflexota bacterium]
METHIAARLVQLNQQFYQTFGAQFSATRQRIQPGVRRILDQTPPDANILDLGCGNGELAQELLKGGYHGRYLGLDFSQALLDVAKSNTGKESNITFARADLADSTWDNILPAAPFDLIFSFAVFHHLPGDRLRRNTVNKIGQRLAPNGKFIHSHWQFLSSPKLRARVQPWDVIGLSRAEVDQGDHLLDWRRGGYGLRYVHHASEDYLNSLASGTGFQVEDAFYSDGAEGNLGFYQIWGKRSGN